MCLITFDQNYQVIYNRAEREKKTHFYKDEVTEKKPPFMYKVIETLLPNAVYHAEKNNKGEKLLEL